MTYPSVCGLHRDTPLLANLLASHSVSAVLCVVGLKAVSENVQQPLAYFGNDVGGTVSLCKTMAGVFSLVFSSLATMHREPEAMPISEGTHVGKHAKPCGHCKLMVDDILRDVAAPDPR